MTNCHEVVELRTPVLYLWTKRGAARHAKMLNTSRAREVFELLENAYFERSASSEANNVKYENEFDGISSVKDENGEPVPVYSFNMMLDGDEND